MQIFITFFFIFLLPSFLLQIGKIKILYKIIPKKLSFINLEIVSPIIFGLLFLLRVYFLFIKSIIDILFYRGKRKLEGKNQIIKNIILIIVKIFIFAISIFFFIKSNSVLIDLLKSNEPFSIVNGEILTGKAYLKNIIEDGEGSYLELKK